MGSVRNWIYLLSILSLAAGPGCSLFTDSLGTEDIVVTDEQGNILEDNKPDEWQPRIGSDNLFSVKPAYPNPSSSKVTIRYEMSEAGSIHIGVYKNHSLIRRLVDGEVDAGTRIVGWDLADDDGKRVAARDYTIRFRFSSENGGVVTSFGTVIVE